MLKKFKKIYNAVQVWTNNTLQPSLDLQLLECKLSPIDRHIVYSGLTNKDGLFHFSYDEWRVKRINKVMEIYGIEYFQGKRILELGAGHGDIGAFFADLGAEVLGLDGRIQNVNFARLKHRRVGNIKFECVNLESDFSHFGRFDLVINFGLIYHLKNIDANLKSCFAVTDDIILETVVCDSMDPHKIYFIPGRKEVDEESLEGTACRPSPFYVERIVKENNFNFTRYFTADLSDPYSYDWEHKNDNRLSEDFVLRRFWRLQKMKTP